ncbi:MAG: right-handed parallel beta-helix repeat-containing protein [Fulvivirga sp.]
MEKINYNYRPFNCLIFLAFLFSCGEEISPAAVDDILEGCNDTYALNYDERSKFPGNTCEYAPVACANCDYVLEANVIELNNDELQLPPGSTIGIKGGNRDVINIQNFNGTATKPFYFTNCDGQAIISLSDSPEAIRIRNSSHVRLTGTGSSDQFGLVIANGAHGVRAYQKADNLEIDHLEVMNVGVGIWAVTRPLCDGSLNQGTYVQENIKIHHNYVHDVHGEGMYIGGSKWDVGFNNNDCPGEKLLQADLKGIHVYNNIVEDTGWDGIQVGGAIEDCEIYNNIVRNYGLENVTIHQAGLMINPGTTGKIYSNFIEGGTGNAIHIIGFDNLVYSNVILNCKANAVHLGDRDPFSGKSYRIVNNTFINISGDALHNNSSESVSNIFYNNFMAKIGNEAFFNKSDNTDISHNIVSETTDGYLFENPDNVDYTPMVGSVLLDSGRMYNRDELLVDFMMRPRFSGESLDIGAYENQE